MHECTRMHTCTHMHVKHAKHAKHGCLHVGGHLQFLYMYKCACVILSDSGGPPLWGVANGWIGWGCGGCPMYACMNVHACTHACTCMLNMLNMLNMDASMLAAICNFYTCINVRVCMCMCVGTPPCPQMPPQPPAPPKSCREPKTPKSWTNRDNSILFEDSLPLNISELI